MLLILKNKEIPEAFYTGGIVDSTEASNMEKARDGKVWKGPKSQTLGPEFSLWEGIGKSKAALQAWVLWDNYGVGQE